MERDSSSYYPLHQWWNVQTWVIYEEAVLSKADAQLPTNAFYNNDPDIYSFY